MANLPFFYHGGDFINNSPMQLSDESSKHIVQVLRMKEGEQIFLNNGNGYSALATIISAEKKKCSVQIEQVQHLNKPPHGLHLCVAFTKNTSRNEWLLEKATELGVSSITPIISARTEREKYRTDRWQNILVAAMLQSQQYYLPELKAATKLELIIKEHQSTTQKLIAHCEGSFERKPISELIQPDNNTVILIGPEGDFSPEEIQLCYDNNFSGTIFCSQRLRTETAAMAICAYYNLLNNG
jgi:16S rRNA (uracil1498-N3)-methyltransferase